MRRQWGRRHERLAKAKKAEHKDYFDSDYKQEGDSKKRDNHLRLWTPCSRRNITVRPSSPLSSDPPSVSRTPEALLATVPAVPSQKEDLALLRRDVDSLKENQQKILKNQETILRLQSLMTKNTTTQTINTCKTKESSSFTDPRVWDLRPCDMPYTFTDEAVRRSLSQPSTDPQLYRQKTPVGETDSLAKELVCRLFTLGDLFGRAMHGRTRGKSGSRKPMKKDIVSKILSTCFQAFPTHGQHLEVTTACVNTIDTYNRYLWNKRLSKVNFPALPQKYMYL